MKIHHYIISAFFLMATAVLSCKSYQHLNIYKTTRTELAEELDFKNRLLDIREWIGSDKQVKTKLLRASKLENDMQESKKKSIRISLMNAAIILMYVLILFAVSKTNQLKAFSLLSAALMSLLPGLMLPMLELAALVRDLVVPIDGVGLISMALGSEKVFEGDIYFYFQCKSVLELVELLFEQRNFVVGISIFVFSILIPILKLLASYVIILSKRHGRRFEHLIQYIGKWSMADVFVAAAFLAYLAFNNMKPGIQTESTVLPGLYFFLAYCIFSISSSYFLSKSDAVND